MTDDPGMLPEPDAASSGEEDGPVGPPEKMNLAFYGALALIGFLVILVVFLNYPGARASAGTVMTATNWTLQSYTDRTGILVPAITGSGVTVRFRPDGSMQGSSGCNQYAAAYTTRDYAITIANATSTLMFCAAPGIMDQESAYLADLPKAVEFRVSDSYLKLYDREGKQVLAFIPA
jgi:heat shock protein HslJ